MRRFVREMRARLLRSLCVCLLVQCAIWIAIAPILPYLHQAFATHAHVYCFNHARIEDADARPSTSTGAFQQRSNDPRWNESAVLPLGTGLPSDESRHECLFSNTVLLSTTTDRAAFPRFASIVAADIHRAHVAEFPNLAVLYIAPKQSPPGSLEHGVASPVLRAGRT